MHPASPRFIRPAPLAGSLSLILASAVAAQADDSAVAPAADATGMTIAVKNCNDSGPGSLRAAVTGALSGDTIDMTALACRRINLTSGAIVTYQNDLTLVGGGGMTVDANRTSPIFHHYGNGWLRIRGMTLARGRNRISYDGGCIYSLGKVELRNSLVHWCLAWTPDYSSDGGGIYARDVVTLIDSQVVGNTADSRGGGVFTDRLITFRSRICGNHAGSGGGAHVSGGAHTMGGVNINSTTFSGNTGGALTLGDGGDRDSVIANSTISGNYGRRVGATGYAGTIVSMYVDEGSATIINSTISGNTPGSGSTVSISGRERSIVNSTIAFNQHTGYDGSPCPSGAAAVVFWGRPESPHIESTIAANNVCDGNPIHDISTSDIPDPEPEVVGANNLIMSSNVPLPPDTISVDPRLAPLADNGGLTKTHALLDDSPAIDAGNNAAGLPYDQRRAGFPRVKGPQADIGAYER